MCNCKIQNSNYVHPFLEKETVNIAQTHCSYNFSDDFSLNFFLIKFYRISMHRIHNGAQNHQVEAGQASSSTFCKFASF